MKKYLLVAFLSSTLLLVTSIAHSKGLKRVEYDLVQSDSHIFVEVTNNTKTFVFEQLLKNETTLRLEFNISEFPYQKTFNLPISPNASKKILADIKKDHKQKHINDRDLKSLQQSFEFEVIEFTPGVYIAKYKLIKIGGLSAITSLNGKDVTLLGEQLISSSNYALLSQGGSRDYHGTTTKQGWKETIISMP